MSAAQIDVRDLSWIPKGKTSPLLHPTNFSLRPGAVLGLVGPNGAGKTSLLRLLYRLHRPSSGQVLLDGQDIWGMSARACARRIAVVLQEQPSDFALTVYEIVALGRTPHRRGFAGTGGAQDARLIDKALARLDLAGLAHRTLGSLSGGERQRVMVARALAQEPHLLILDEPTNHLDIRHQLEILALIRGLPVTIITSLHDLNLAADVCDDLLMLNAGRTVGFGPPAQVLCEADVARTFQVGTRRDHLTHAGKDHLTFHLQNEGHIR